MQKFNVIGVNKIEYTNKKTNAKQNAIILYTTYDFSERDNSEGCGCETFFCTGDLYADAECITVGDQITVSYNKTGYLTSIEVI